MPEPDDWEDAIGEVGFAVDQAGVPCIVIGFGRGASIEMDVPSAVRLARKIHETVLTGLKKLKEERS